jgi:hypothetical protein
MLSAAAVFLELDKLIASDTVSLDELGTSVAVSSDGHTVVAGSPAEDGGRGAAYVYERDGESFVETKLTASDGSLFDHFGRSVSVSSDGQTVVVGSPDDDDGPTGWPEDAGAVYVYRSDGSGFLETKLVPSDRSPEFSPYAKFGTSVAISADGQTVVVGSPLVGNDKGMTYLYRWDGESFVETKLNASDAADFDFFGTSVAMSGDGQTVVVGSPGDNDAVEDGGSIYVYQWDGAGFVETELTASDAAGGAQFGASVAISAEGQTVVTGSPADGSGSAYVYRWDGATFAETKLTGGEAASGDRFGSTVTVSADGQTVMIGSPGDRSAGDSGSA